MFGVMDYGAFVVAVIVFLAIPGPGNLALVTSTGKGGLAGGLAATLGVIAGDQVLIWLAVDGMAALLSTSPVLFAYLGAAATLLLFFIQGDLVVLGAWPGATPCSYWSASS